MCHHLLSGWKILMFPFPFMFSVLIFTDSFVFCRPVALGRAGPGYALAGGGSGGGAGLATSCSARSLLPCCIASAHSRSNSSSSWAVALSGGLSPNCLSLSPAFGIPPRSKGSLRPMPSASPAPSARTVGFRNGLSSA
ncbi:hypothetical protein C8R47DRAFT_1096868 [Mycena vitilis]|nr:hypothetical protein C8R47DRAFT_1096868 [Mycena vitilis]